jgi:predicted ATPase/serine phosphatase RsbU (regulator of sigma subunit)/tRNA A-37 threonylcarbamoyl transferase component Bud32
MEIIYSLNLEGYEILSRVLTQSKRDLYIAFSKALNKKVIVKNVSSGDDLNPAVVNLRNEYEIIKYLSDELELQAYDFIKHTDGFALVMDYIEGPSLREKITQGPMEIDTFFHYAIELTHKLQKIHSKKVIHKDIKPDNVIVENETNTLVLIDFGISTRLQKQESNWTPPNVLEGSIPYISPEQTGRMNRIVDYRTDFYSLGVTFYEMITGRLPFESEDLLEVIHSHLAKLPEPPVKIRPNLPLVLSDLILKLMNKTAEDRYQSARSIYLDLYRCYEEWKSTGKIDYFTLGEKDLNEEFKIPQKLYGREKEVEILLSEYQATSTTGTSRVILIGGYSGIGKTSLVKEIYKPMTASRGHFLAGKYDQYNKNVPYSAIIQAFTGLVKSILTEPPDSIAIWKMKIFSAVGVNGKILTDVIPELEFIIGPQPPLEVLSVQENANRFYVVFQNFIKVFTDSANPMVIFLDDLQWADNASLELLKNLLTDSSVKYLFLMLSYRDNEVDGTHPFSEFVNFLIKENVQVTKILLKTLEINDVKNLLSDALQVSPTKVENLSSIVLSKTAGNPFFISELLKQLVSDNLIYFKHSTTQTWHWDEEKIKESEISSNVLELLLNRIRKLNLGSQTLLKYSSCIGINFDLQTLVSISQVNGTIFQKNLLETIQEELIVPLGGSFRILYMDFSEIGNFKKDLKFKFQHDRIQQACYNLLTEQEKSEIHLHIARIFYERYKLFKEEELLFEIVSHYNQALSLLPETEKSLVLDLNLKAAQKAKQSNAYLSSLNMLKTAYQLYQQIPENKQILFLIFEELSELEYLNGNLEEAEVYAFKALNLAETTIEKVRIYDMLITQFSARGMYDKALENIIAALKLVGLELPNDNYQEFISKENQKIVDLINKKSISSLVELPLMEDPLKVAGVRILIGAVPTAYNKVPELFPIISILMTRLHLEFGNLPDSYGYSMYGIILNTLYGKYQEAYEFTDLALNVSEKYKNTRGITKACNILANYAIPFVRHIKYAEDINAKCVRSSLESGELLHGSYGAMNDAINIFYQGKRLDKVSEKLELLYSYAKRTKSNLAIDTILGVLLIIENLKRTSLDLEITYFQWNEFDELKFLELCELHQSKFPICLFKVMKAKVFLIYGKYEKALIELETAKDLLYSITGQYSLTEHNFNTSLVLTLLYKSLSIEKRKEALKIIKENQKQLKIWATSCSENYLHKYLFIEAQLARLTYKNWKAAKYYDTAIIEARKNDFIQNEALFLEIAAQFWMSKGNNKIANQYLHESYQRYKAWGAESKCLLMLETYVDFLTDYKKSPTTISRPIIPSAGAGKVTQTELYTTQTLDLQSVFKSSSAISSEIKLENLLKKLLNILIENAGAQKGVLLLKRSRDWKVEAVGNAADNQVELLGIPLQEFIDLPHSLIYYVERTKESVVLDKATRDERFQADEYIKKNQIKSILCSPILKQGELLGILYLENNLTEDAFTFDRLQVISLLSSQAAISIDNAFLYDNLEAKVKERTLELAKLNEELALKNQHITDSIQYAVNIQLAILPNPDEIKKYFQDLFVLFLPKDIVSGDFYWFSKVNNTIFLAVVDCTGHGVPGALMSMIGNTILNQLVNERKLTDPAQILRYLNFYVRTILKQDTEDTNSSDGMELCLCKIEGEEIYFAGAKRPILIVTPEEVIEIKGDRYPIGGRQNEGREYTTHKLELPRNKKFTIYLTTDGYADQPNPERQRITSKGFYKILQSICNLSSLEQKNILLNKLQEHSKEEAQRDDITVLGFIP